MEEMESLLKRKNQEIINLRNSLEEHKKTIEILNERLKASNNFNEQKKVTGNPTITEKPIKDQPNDNTKKFGRFAQFLIEND